MHDIGSQLVLKWARQGPQCRIQASEDFSRLTLDTIALCAMDYRFNSFYQEDMHPFVKAMNNSLGAANNAGQLASLVSRLLPSHKEQLKRDDELMERTSREIVQYRRGHPTEKKDLLNALIYGKDPKTNQTMRDALIAANMVTFLIAGKYYLKRLMQLNSNTYRFQAMRRRPDSSLLPSSNCCRTRKPTLLPRKKLIG